MRTLMPTLTLATFALGLGAIALFAQQNATLIQLKLFSLTLLSLPLGLILTFAVMAGLLLALLFQGWLTSHR
jgi:uncharacterized integral membrane protein